MEFQFLKIKKLPSTRSGGNEAKPRPKLLVLLVIIEVKYCCVFISISGIIRHGYVRYVHLFRAPKSSVMRFQNLRTFLRSFSRFRKKDREFKTGCPVFDSRSLIKFSKDRVHGLRVLRSRFCIVRNAEPVVQISEARTLRRFRH